MHRLTAGRRPGARLAAGLLAGLLAACASGPPDGPPARPPAGLEHTPDAVPRVEPLRVGGPNKPYEVLGRRYHPQTADVPLREEGLASWYGRKFHGRRTASGEVYDMYAMTAAHKTMPLPSYARVRNPANGREIVVRVNDRGPFVSGRVIDLSYAAAVKLGVRGVAPVEVERLTFAAIRSGEAGRPWASAPPPVERAAEPPAPPPFATTGAPGYWVQLGAFREQGGAEDFQRRVSADLAWLTPLMTVFSDAPLFRLQAGPYASLDDARSAAERVREALRLVPVIVERR